MELWAQAEDEATSGTQRVSFYLSLDRKLGHAVALSATRAFSYPSVSDSAPAANLDLVLDVELNVTLRFGQRQLTLREVLGLTSARSSSSTGRWMSLWTWCSMGGSWRGERP